MWKLRVNGNSNHFTAILSKFFGFGIEGDDLGRTNKSEVKRVEEKDHILAFERLDINVDKVSVIPGGSGEGRSWLSD
jgi:hypothetical protein